MTSLPQQPFGAPEIPAFEEDTTFLKLLYDNLPAIVVELDAKGTIIQTNPEFERITGYTPEQLQGKNWIEVLIPVEERERLRQVLAENTAQGKTVGIQNPIITIQGETIHTEWFNFTIDRDPENEHSAPHTIAVGFDITGEHAVAEREQALASEHEVLNERLKITIELLKAVINTSTARQFIILGKEGQIEEANDAAASRFHTSADEMHGRLINTFDFQDAHDEVILAVELAVSNGQFKKVSIQEGDTFCDVYITPLADRRSTILGAMITMQDVTQALLRQQGTIDQERRIRLQRDTNNRLAENEHIQQGNLVEAAQAITEAAVETMQIDTVSVWMIRRDQTVLTCIDRLDRDKSRHSRGEQLSIDMTSSYIKQLTDGHGLDVRDVRTASVTEEFATYHEGHGIVSMLDIPVFRKRDGRLIGVICLEHCTERTWHPDELSFSDKLGEKFSDAVNNRERVRFMKNMRNMPIAYYHSTPEGRLEFENPAFQRLFGVNEEDCETLNTRDLWVNSEDKALFLEKLKQEHEVHNFVAPLLRPDGTVFIGSLSATSECDEDGKIILIMGQVVDVTDFLAKQQQTITRLEEDRKLQE